MMRDILSLLAELARRTQTDLAPDWADIFAQEGAAPDLSDFSDPREALGAIVATLGWPDCRIFDDAPRPDDFPLLVHDPEQGWAIAEQWEARGLLRVIAGGEPTLWTTADRSLTFFGIRFPETAQNRAPKRALDVFLDALRKRKRLLIDMALATVVLNIVTLGVSMFTMQVYDRVVPREGYSTLAVLTFGALIALGFDFILRVARSVLLERESAAMDGEISEFFFSRAQAIRLDVRQGEVGTLAAQLRGFDQIRALLSSASVFAIADLPFALFFIWVIFMLAGPIAFIPLVSFILALILGVVFAWLVHRQAAEAQTGAYRKNGLLVEALDAAETIKAARGHWEMIARWNKLVDHVEANESSLKRWSAVAQAAASSLQQIAYIALIAVGALEIIKGNITTGTLIACSIISGRVNGPLIMQLPTMIIQASYARSALRGLDQLLDLPVDRDPEGDFLRPEKLGCQLKLDNVSFTYAGARAGVQVSKLEIAPGERVAIIGPVGSGKSTLLKLLAGLYHPQQGNIFIDGLEMSQVAEDQLRSHVGYLSQDYRLVKGTLRDQLTLGYSDPGDDAIIRAAEATGLSQLIASHPQGLALPIGEGGRGLSGGQRAQAGLTRLLLAQPKLWLLDEPTSALDQETEERVLRSVLGAMSPESSLLFVTHKIPLLSLVQRVIVVMGGKIVLDGPTASVLNKLRENKSNRTQGRPAVAAGVKA